MNTTKKKQSTIKRIQQYIETNKTISLAEYIEECTHKPHQSAMAARMWCAWLTPNNMKNVVADIREHVAASIIMTSESLHITTLLLTLHKYALTRSITPRILDSLENEMISIGCELSAPRLLIKLTTIMNKNPLADGRNMAHKMLCLIEKTRNASQVIKLECLQSHMNFFAVDPEFHRPKLIPEAYQLLLTMVQKASPIMSMRYITSAFFTKHK